MRKVQGMIGKDGRIKGKGDRLVSPLFLVPKKQLPSTRLRTGPSTALRTGFSSLEDFVESRII